MNRSMNEKLGGRFQTGLDEATKPDAEPAPTKRAGKRVNRLLAIELDRLPPGLHADGDGLYLQVTSKSARSWVWRYRAGDKLRGLGLGPLRLYSLGAAREMARDAARLRRLGVDPIDARKARKEEAAAEVRRQVTFWQVAEAYIGSHRAGWKNAKHADQWRATLETYVKPLAGDKPIGALDTELILKILDPIWRVKPETAGRVRGRIELILNYAKARGQRDGENPARWRGHLDQLLPACGKVAKVVHHAALNWRQAPAFFTALGNQAGRAAEAFAFAILTSGRTGEVIGATWPEIDFEQSIWTIPGGRMKGDKEHRVPLSKPALDILARMKAKTGGAGFVFPGQKSDAPLSNMALLAVLKRMKRDDLTAHGFRSTFRDWATEATDFPSEAIELALAHSISSKVEAAYRRGDMLDKRRDLAAAWARYLTVVKAESCERRSEKAEGAS